MRLGRLSLTKQLLGLWAVGGAVLGLATWICFTLNLDSSATAFVYLAIIVFLSLRDSFLSSAIFSVASVASLDFFFVDPKFSFQIQYSNDLPLIGMFLLTSFVITGLVRRLQLSKVTLERQARLLDLTHDTVVVRDAGDVITFWSRGAENLYGWSSEEAVGKISHVLLKTVFPQARETIDDRLRRSGHWEGELVNTNRDGTQVIVASRWSVQRDDSGRPNGTLETNNDITERRRAEAALRRSQAAYLAEAQKLSLTGSFGWNADNGQVFWSEQSFAILGVDSAVEPSIGLLLERVHPDEIESVRRAFDRASQDGSEFDIEFRLLLANGSIKHVHAVAHVMADETDRAQFVGALMDITPAKLAEMRLQEAQAQVAHVARVTSLGVLSASIAHEVNQPLAAIVSHGEASLRWLNREVPRLDEVASSIRHVIANGKRASGIVQRIRGLIGKAEQQRSVVNLNDLVEEVIPLVRNEAARHRTLLQLDLGDGPFAVSGDPIQLQQVLINLVINAIQAMATVEDRTRSVVVSTRAEEGDLVVLDVADSGPGIDADQAAHVFDAFYTTKPGGMGMGLSVCRSIIEAHGGQISVLSRPSGPGAVFRCVLPRVARAIG